jgi:iron complex outermembrane receptor protein
MQKPGRGTQSGVVPTASDPNLSAVVVPGLPDNWNSMSKGDFRHSTTNGLSAWADVVADEHWDVRAGYSHQDSTVDALFSGNFGMANNMTFLQGRRLRSQTYVNWGNTVDVQAVGKYRSGSVSTRFLVGAQYVSRLFTNKAGQAANDPALGNDPTASPRPLWDLRDPATWDRDAQVAPGPLSETPNRASSVSKDRAVYAGATVGFFDDRLLVLAGVRQTWTDSRLTNRVAATPTTKIDASRLTPQYGALFKAVPGIALFVSYAESFVPGSQVLLVQGVPTKPAAPTVGRGVEGGVKFDGLGERVSGTLTCFDIRNDNVVNDLASLDPGTGALVLTHVQSGEQRSRGVELDTTVSLTPSWQVYASYGYMDARIVEFSGHDAAILAQDPALLDAAQRANYKNVKRFHGAPLQMSAPHLANLWSRYDVSRGNLLGLFFAGGISLVYDQTLLPDTPQSAHQTYTLLGATVGYSRELRGLRIILDLTGKNLADQRYRPSQSTRSRPREFLLTGTLKL